MQRVSQGYRPDGLHWLFPDAEKYHRLMYDTLSLMREFPMAIVENEDD